MARENNPALIPVATEEPVEPRIHEATCGSNGAVSKGALVDLAVATARRQAGLDIVVCGPNGSANRRLAGHIERTANVNVILEFPHRRAAGAHALPHWQPDPRPPQGHSFYETEHRKAR